MNEQQGFDLLTDLVKLLKRHGPQAFEDLAEIVSRPNFGEQIALVLRATAKASPSTTPRTRVNNATRDLRYSLVELEKTEPEKSALLVAFYDGVLGKKLLPTLDHLNALGAELGIPTFKSVTRIRATHSLIDRLKALPLAELQKALFLVKPIEGMGDDRSMAGWSQLILSKKRTAEPLQEG